MRTSRHSLVTAAARYARGSASASSGATINGTERDRRQHEEGQRPAQRQSSRPPPRSSTPALPQPRRWPPASTRRAGARAQPTRHSGGWRCSCRRVRQNGHGHDAAPTPRHRTGVARQYCLHHHHCGRRRRRCRHRHHRRRARHTHKTGRRTGLQMNADAPLAHTPSDGFSKPQSTIARSSSGFRRKSRKLDVWMPT